MRRATERSRVFPAAATVEAPAPVEIGFPAAPTPAAGKVGPRSTQGTAPESVLICRQDVAIYCGYLGGPS